MISSIVKVLQQSMQQILLEMLDLLNRILLHLLLLRLILENSYTQVCLHNSCHSHLKEELEHFDGIEEDLTC